MTDTAQRPGAIVSRGLAATATGVIVIFTILRYVVLSGAAAGWLADLTWTVFSGAAAFRCFLTATRARVPNHRIGWRLLGSGAALWCIGMLILVWGQASIPSYSTYPTSANWLFLSLAPLFAAGVLFLRSHSEAPADGKRLADLGLISCSVLTSAVLILLDPLLETGQSAEGVFFSVLDPAAFVTATLFTLALYRLDDLRGLGPVAVLLLGAVSVHMVADIVYFWAILNESLTPPPLAPAWLVAFGLQFLAADAYDRIKTPQAPPALELGSRGVRHGVLEAALPAPLIAVPALVTIIFHEQLSNTTFLAVASLVLVFAIFLGFRELWVDRAEDRALRRLEASIDLTNQILAASPAAVFTLEPNDHRTPTFFTGGGGQTFGIDSDATGDWTQRIHPEEREAVRRHLTSTVDDGGRSFDCRLMDVTGSYRWVTMRLAPYKPNDVRTARLVGSIVDVDDAKRLETRLLRGQRMEALGRLSGGIAHDFNNLLTTILGYAELGAMEPGLTPNAKESLEAVREAAKRARGLTRQLLAFSRRQEMRMEVIDLRERVRDMTNMLTRTLGPDISVDLNLPQAPTPVRADPSQVEQVILNLVVNAGDAMAKGGNLRIEVEEVLVGSRTPGDDDMPPGRYARLSVTDTGVGMVNAVKERVFEPFFTTKEGGRGTGLGLATLHGVVRQHSGYVEVVSQVGVGTTFHVYLPSADGPVPEPEDTPSAPIGTGSEWILVVDDEPSIPKLLDGALSRAGYRVLTASSAKAAIELAEDPGQEIDLLLTDVVMPEMTGRDLAARVRDLRPGLPVVFMSGAAAESHLLTDRAGRSIPFLGKPLALGKLAAVLRAVLDDPALEKGRARI